MGSLFGRLLFAAKFGEPNLLLSDRVNADSKILWNRTPRQRVEAVAPWLTVDGDSYPAVVDGRIVWIVDGYTTTNGYPYSELTSLGDATTDSVNATSTAIAAQAADQVNYIRNSVKATVDAYDGTVTLYAVGQDRPRPQGLGEGVPRHREAVQAIPPDLMTAPALPAGPVQGAARAVREVPRDRPPRRSTAGRTSGRSPTTRPRATGGSDPQPPYYLTLEMPGQSAPSFSLTTTFAPNGSNRDNLAAFMAVDSQPGPDYGKFRVLQLPRSLTVPGPGQVQNTFEADPTISSELSLLRRGGSDVEYGNLLSLPVGGGLLYVEPVYVRATSGATFPLLQKVLVSFGNIVKMDDTLGQALDAVFNGNSGSGTTPPGGGTTPPPGGGTTPPPGTNAALAKALADAQAALIAEDKALKAGDFAAYGVAQKALAAAVQAAINATKATTPTPSPSASASASP